MKKIFIILFFLGFAQIQAQEDYTFYRVDTLNSKIYWKCDKHNGLLKLRDGGFVLKNDSIVAGKFILDMRTIKDLDMDPKQYGTAVLILENTLKNEFFEVKKYPFAVFDLQEIKHLQAGQYELTGDFTLHGNTVCVTFKATIDFSGDTISLKSEKFDLDRTDWGIYRMSPKRPYSDDDNGWTVSDKLSIQLELILKKE